MREGLLSTAGALAPPVAQDGQIGARRPNCAHTETRVITLVETAVAAQRDTRGG